MELSVYLIKYFRQNAACDRLYVLEYYVKHLSLFPYAPTPRSAKRCVRGDVWEWRCVAKDDCMAVMEWRLVGKNKELKKMCCSSISSPRTERGSPSCKASASRLSFGMNCNRICKCHTPPSSGTPICATVTYPHNISEIFTHLCWLKFQAFRGWKPVSASYWLQKTWNTLYTKLASMCSILYLTFERDSN